MASTTFSGRSNISLNVVVSETSTSQSTNTSVVNINVYLSLDNTTYRPYDSSGTSTWSVTVNGTSYSGSYNYDFSGQSAGYTLGLYNGNLSVPHNSDGSKTISYSGSSNAASPLGSADVGTNSLTLTRFYLWGDRRTASAWTANTIAKRWNGTTWVELTTAKRWSGSTWVNLS